MRKRKVVGIAGRPRLSVFRSLSNIYAQIIDDTQGSTLVAASSLEKGADKKGKKLEIARAVGLAIAKKAAEKKIDKVVFDRGPFRFHGRVKALADAAREGGLKF